MVCCSATIQEKFGDGIMSAIDFTMDVKKEVDQRGQGHPDYERQVLTLQEVVNARDRRGEHHRHPATGKGDAGCRRVAPSRALSLLLALSCWARGRGQSSVPGERPAGAERTRPLGRGASRAGDRAEGRASEGLSKRERPSGTPDFQPTPPAPVQIAEVLQQHERAEPAEEGAAANPKTGLPSKSRWSVCIARSPLSSIRQQAPEQMATPQNYGEILRELRAQCRAGRHSPERAR